MISVYETRSGVQDQKCEIIRLTFPHLTENICTCVCIRKCVCHCVFELKFRGVLGLVVSHVLFMSSRDRCCTWDARARVWIMQMCSLLTER